MSYRPDEKDWMAYLYGEMEGEEKERFEQYLAVNEEARKQLHHFKGLRNLMGQAEDKEVIAPPIVFADSRTSRFWDAPYFRTVIGIAASLIVVMMVARFAGTNISFSENELRISFGSEPAPAQTASPASLTPKEIQRMIDASVAQNNTAIRQDWQSHEVKLNESIRQNLAVNSSRINALMKEASSASQEQVRGFVAAMQTENMKQVKDYFQLTSAEQKSYIENLLVDFAGYLQQQRNNDLQLVQMKMQSIEKDTDLFKQETEQILASIITTVGAPAEGKEVKN